MTKQPRTPSAGLPVKQPVKAGGLSLGGPDMPTTPVSQLIV